MSAERSDQDSRRIRVVWNPMAGRKAGVPTNRASREMLLELMARHGLGEDLVETGSEEEALDAARDAVGREFEVVVAAGGDGSVSMLGRS